MRSAVQLTLVASLLSLASAADHQVIVGMGGLAYSPASVTAAMGDTVTFVWQNSIPHTVSQSSFAAPCSELSGGFDSGVVTASASSPVSMVVTVTSTDPIWFFCKTTSHCQAGMAGVINPSAANTLDAFLTAARATNGQGGTSSFVGTGVGASAAALVTGSGSAASSASSTAMSSAASTSAASGTSTSAPASSAPATSAAATTASASAPAASTTAPKSPANKLVAAGGSIFAGFAAVFFVL